MKREIEALRAALAAVHGYVMPHPQRLETIKNSALAVVVAYDKATSGAPAGPEAALVAIDAMLERGERQDDFLRTFALRLIEVGLASPEAVVDVVANLQPALDAEIAAERVLHSGMLNRLTAAHAVLASAIEHFNSQAALAASARTLADALVELRLEIGEEAWRQRIDLLEEIAQLGGFESRGRSIVSHRPSDRSTPSNLVALCGFRIGGNIAWRARADDFATASTGRRCKKCAASLAPTLTTLGARDFDTIASLAEVGRDPDWVDGWNDREVADVEEAERDVFGEEDAPP